jgi:hypothetical protein
LKNSRHPEDIAASITPGNRLRIACAALVAITIIALASLAIDPPAFAQDGTSAATPAPPTNCVVPPVTVRTGPQSGADPLVPQVAASPVATPGATPIAAPGGSSSLQIDITATTRVLGHCLSEGKNDTVVKLTGDAFRGQLLGDPGGVDGNTYLALAGMMLPWKYSIVSIEGIRGTGRGTAEATVTYTIAHQLRRELWTYRLVSNGGSYIWTVDAAKSQSVTAPSNAATIVVNMTNNAYRLVPNAAQGSAVTLAGTNNDQMAHEMLVLRLAPGVSTETVLTSYGPGLPEGVEFIGQLTVPARSTGSLTLVNLEPGTYTIVCLLPDAAGVPDLANGMQTTFTISR